MYIAKGDEMLMDNMCPSTTNKYCLCSQSLNPLLRIVPTFLNGQLF